MFFNGVKMFGFKSITDDKFYNRRRLAVLVTFYAVVWGFVILACDMRWGMDAAKVAIYLGFVSTIAGLPVLGYIKASAVADIEKTKAEKVDIAKSGGIILEKPNDEA